VRLHIYDMDGTIVDSLHRYRTVLREDGRPAIDLAHWIANEHRAYDDSLLPLAAQYQRDLHNPRVFTVIATARALGVPDRRFIRDKLGVPDALVSRAGRSDARGGADLKISGLRRVIEKYKLHNAQKHFWEDNFSYLQKVCQAIGAKGYLIPSAQGW
jgi:hypothetical protein